MSRAWPSVYERSDWQEVHLKGRCSTVPSLHHSTNLLLLVLSSTSGSVVRHSFATRPITPSCLAPLLHESVITGKRSFAGTGTRGSEKARLSFILVPCRTGPILTRQTMAVSSASRGRRESQLVRLVLPHPAPSGSEASQSNCNLYMQRDVMTGRWCCHDPNL
jgi:hypothetical protein